MYAGFTWKVHDATSTSSKDNSIFRMDWSPPVRPGRSPTIAKAYARVKRIFTHTMFPGGPATIFVQGDWYKDEGVCAVAGTQLVSFYPAHPFNRDSKFIPLNECYQQPVALWPHDPLKEMDADDPKKTFFDVIDRNQEQACADD
jgi:hypothetical protein